MTLALEIEYLGGVCFATVGPDSGAPDWPPQPDRVFSALVATWGAHGEPDAEREALEWLEAGVVSGCSATIASPRSAPTAFVPPNDPRLDRAKTAAGVLPALRSRQARCFPACRPDDPVVRYFWDIEPDEEIFSALDNLARDTAYVGHSASLTRCRFLRAAQGITEVLYAPKRRIYPGRLKELQAAYARFQKSADKKDRPSPGATVQPSPPIPAPGRNVFSSRWLFLEHIDGEMCDPRAAALISRRIRTTLMSGYGQLGAYIPTIISGHDNDESPTREPHLAIVPLSFSGFPYADGRVLGFALVPPQASDLLAGETFRKVLRMLTRSGERRTLTVSSKMGAARHQAFSLDFSVSFEPPLGRRSLDASLYLGPAREFATVTPIVLDRHLKKQGQARLAEIASQIATACMRIGLPEPEAIYPDKHSAVQGAVSAYPSGKAPAWMRWQLPASLAGRQLTHAVIRFPEIVEGPVLLGAGRFLGMGLCRPLDQRAS